MATPMPKMSLVAQFDDLCRYTNVLTAGCEEEFKKFVASQRKLTNKWKDAEAQVQKLKSQITVLEAEKNRFEFQMKHMRNLIEEEVGKRKKLEKEKSSMERQIALIKEVLLADGTTIDNQTKEKLFMLSNHTIARNSGEVNKLTTIEESVGSLLSASDLDETDDDFDISVSRRKKKRSKGRRSSGDPYQKRKKSEPTNNLDVPSTDDGLRMEVDTTPENQREIAFRSNSEPSSNSPDLPPTPKVVHRSDSEQIKVRTFDVRIHKTAPKSVGTPVGRYSTGGKLSRTHAFVAKTVIRTEKCYPCGKVIKFMKQALKCTDCRVTCHPECKDQCPLPCVPFTFTPTKGTTGTISDYTSSTAPMIPSLIVHCINEIESRGLKEIGLYRVSGSEREVKDLRDKLVKGRNMTTLNQVDVHAVCGTVKEFLRSLNDSLITRAAWRVFVNAAEHKNESMRLDLVYDAVCQLPQPNKETLAFLVLHLQRVAESPDCRMPLENLAKIFGPTIVGYSTADPADCNMFNETAQQCQVMQCLLSIPSDLWQNLLSIEQPEVFNREETPERLPAPKVSRLGPIYPSSDQRKRNVQVGRNPLTPRSNKTVSRSGRTQFLSPLMK